MMGPRPRPLLDRFNNFIFPEPTTGCWLWTGAAIRQGYGVIGVGPHSIDTAHRVAWKLFRGPIPNGLWVLHKCDTRRCANPDHLYLGTIVENTRDVRERGSKAHWNIRDCVTPESEIRRVANLPRGESHHRSMAKLTELQVLEILKADGPQSKIALRFGVCQQLISRIKRREYWRHLNANT